MPHNNVKKITIAMTKLKGIHDNKLPVLTGEIDAKY